MHRRFISSWVVAVVVSAVVAQAALAGGEPKNEWPFTRPVEARAVQFAAGSTVAQARVAGEAKNELPFTRSVSAIVGKDAGSDSGFSWLDAALGLVSGISLTLAAVGGTQLARHRVPRPA